MKTIDQTFSKFKQPDLLKRKPDLKVCTNHLKDPPMWGKSFVPRRVFGGKEITLVTDKHGNYKRYIKPEKTKKEVDPNGIKYGQTKGVRKTKTGHKKARNQNKRAERKGWGNGRRADRPHADRGA